VLACRLPLKTKSFRLFDRRLRLDIGQSGAAFCGILAVEDFLVDRHTDERKIAFKIGKPSDLDTSPR
jgi:hypothetical protein